jgi:hypothetical protein
MKLTKSFSGLVIVFLLLSLVVTVGAAPSTSDVVTASTVVNSGEIIGADRPSGAGGGRGDKTPPEVSILSPSQSAVVSDSVLISATAIDNVGIKKVEYGIDGAGWTLMVSVGDDIYQATWDSTTVADGLQTITVRATDARKNKGQDSVMVTTANGNVPPPPTAEYELFIEIDYMAGHYPTQGVLDYIEWYYLGNNPTGDLIKVTFDIDDVVPLDPSVSDAEFWTIEAVYNDGNDKGGDSIADFTSKEKWVLFGTTVEGASNVMGYAYIVTNGNDAVAGNYIFIADQAADTWANAAGVFDYGEEVVVLMHEMGHSIGIAKLNPVLGEIYDRDTYSVMSYLSVNNASQYYNWYYSAQYWDTRNMGYYAVS